jgi:ubiquinone/menaquinone biosynthesis C-methylase UbiE
MTSHSHSHRTGDPHAERGSAGRRFDLAAYIARMEAPDRADWQKPGEVMAALGLARGQVAGEIGAGTGYFALRMARAVGEEGAVFAAEVEPEILGALRERVEQSGAVNVVPVLGLPSDPLLPRAAFDLLLAVNVFHHVEDRVGLLRRLMRTLKPGGRIANIDFHRRELPVGPPPDHKLGREDFLASAQDAGLALAAEHAFLPYQYFLELRPRGI